MLSPLHSLYRGLTSVAEPLAGPLLDWRLKRGKEEAARLGERRGHPGRPRPRGRLAWLHGASVGESVALLPLIDALVAAGLHVLVTTGTVTSARVLAGRLPGGVTHQYVPLDFASYWQRFLDHWRPDLVLLAESELWPNLVHAVGRRGCPLVLVNARLSERSARHWLRAEGLIRTMLGQANLCLAQAEADAARFRRFGLDDVRVTGNLKYDVVPPPASAEEVSGLAASIGTRPVWLAASTHAEEETLLIDTHEAVRHDHPNLLTLVVPRQPVRGAAIAAAAAARDIPVALRSRGQPIGPAGIYVADTIGEVGLFYRLADLVFVGKSLGGGGGQSPIEAAKLGKTVLHGPRVENLRDVYALLDEAEGALEVADASSLAETVSSLLADPARLRRIARAAIETMQRHSGATARTIEALAPYLPGTPMRRRVS